MTDETGPTANTSVTVPGTGTTIELGDLKASMAAELAAELDTPDSVRKRYGLSKEQWDLLRKNPTFRGMLKDALTTWRGSLAAGARITKKAEIMLEDLLPELYGIIKDGTTPSSERIKGIQTLADLAGRSAKTTAPAGPAQGGFTLNMQFGGDKTISINGKPDGPE